VTKRQSVDRKHARLRGGCASEETDEVVPYKVLPDVLEEIEEVVRARLRLFSHPHSSVEVH